jgi:putative MATE family efflux protein
MNSRKSLIKDYTSGPLTRQLLSFAWPFMLSNLLQTAYNLTDMVVVGQFVGAAGLSAVAIGADLLHMYTFIAMGFCNAGQVLISQYVGLQDRRSVSKIVGVMFTFILGLSLVITAIGLAGVNLWMRLLNVPPEALRYCVQYTVCCTAGLFFMFGYIMISAMLRGMGESKRPMIFIAIASVLNIVLDVILVGAGMGPLGAAAATVTAQGVSFIVSVVYLWRNRHELGFDFVLRDLIPDRHNLMLLLKLGVPMMIQSCAISLSSLFVSSRINVFGVTASAVTGVGSKLSTIASIIALALSQSGATIVGQNFAARKFDRVRKVLTDSVLIGGSFAAILSAVIIAWPEQVFSLFNDEPAVLAMSHAYVLIAVLNYFGWAVRSPSTALCNGMGFPLMNFILGIFDGVVMRIGLCVLLGDVFGLGIRGYWMGSAIAGYAFFLVMLPYFLSGRWQKRAPTVST